MKVGILGSGFGLYGYLPALILGGKVQVLLPVRYKKKMFERSDVSRFTHQVRWLNDEEAVLNAAEALVISQRPEDQVRIIKECCTRDNIGYLLLEKPLGSNPLTAGLTLDLLSRTPKAVRIGYTFRYTSWAHDLVNLKYKGTSQEPITIEWHFRASHYQTSNQNWKRLVSMGGGAVRFFGIHLIALLAEIGYTTVRASAITAKNANEAEQWTAIFTAPELPDAHICLDSNATSSRFLVQTDRLITSLSDPFEMTQSTGHLDRRVTVIGKLCNDLFHSSPGFPRWYQAVGDLWLAAESLAKQNADKVH